MKYFTPEGDPALFACLCGKCDAAPTAELLDAVDLARDFAGVPFVVTSGPRCQEYSEQQGHSMTSEHISGHGADISARDSATRFAIIKGALEAGIPRIGIARTFVHLGVSEAHDPSVAWLY